MRHLTHKPIAIALATVATAATGATATAAPAADSRLRDTLQQDADDLLAQGAPGVLAGVRSDAGDLKVRSGFANLQTRRRVDWDTRFRIGSMTKPMVSTTVLQLVGEDRLSLDDTVERWLPGLVRGRGNDGRDITIRQLLQHTSGLPDYVPGLEWLFARESFQRNRFDTYTPRQLVRVAMKTKPTFAPGSSWSYSNTNYVLAGLVIEAVTGRAWQDEVRDRIVVPLRMEDTVLPGTDPGLPAPHAVGYERFPGPGATAEDPRYGKAIDATRLNPSWGGAAGEVISTTDDANTFLRALVRGDLLEPAQQAELQDTVPTNGAFRTYFSGATASASCASRPRAGRSGRTAATSRASFMTRNGVRPDGSRSVVVTVNTDSLKRKAGVPAPKSDVATQLIDHALCPH